MIHDAKIEKPLLGKEGVSDPVVVFTDNEMVLIAWWNGECWNNIEADSEGIKTEWFGNVLYWTEITFPTNWVYDDEVYC